MASEEALSKQLHCFLRTYVESLKLSDCKFHVTKGSNKGDNYIGLIYDVKIEGAENGKTKHMHFILKTASSIETGKILQPRKLYLREIFFYREVSPIFKEILKELGVAADLFPAFYDANNESGNEALLLENLKHEGFTMAKSRLMDYPHVSLAIRRLGEFHACSFAIRAADPTGFNKLKQMEEPMFSRQIDTSSVQHKQPLELINIVLKLLMDEDKYYVERFRAFSINVYQNIIDAADGSLAEPYAVVNHGDAWTNNILFKYDQKSENCCEKIPRDLRFLDFQLCRYASPVLDITYMLFCSCKGETRRKYYDQLLREYHDSLSSCLRKLGHDPNVLFPYEALLQQLLSFGKYAAGMILLALHFIMDPTSEMATRLDKKIIEERIQNNSFYGNTLKNAFIDLIDKNYI